MRVLLAYPLTEVPEVVGKRQAGPEMIEAGERKPVPHLVLAIDGKRMTAGRQVAIGLTPAGLAGLEGFVRIRERSIRRVLRPPPGIRDVHR